MYFTIRFLGLSAMRPYGLDGKGEEDEKLAPCYSNICYRKCGLYYRNIRVAKSSFDPSLLLVDQRRISNSSLIMLRFQLFFKPLLDSVWSMSKSCLDLV